MIFHNQDRQEVVILSAAKDLTCREPRFFAHAQNDKGGAKDDKGERRTTGLIVATHPLADRER